MQVLRVQLARELPDGGAEELRGSDRPLHRQAPDEHLPRDRAVGAAVQLRRVQDVSVRSVKCLVVR